VGAVEGHGRCREAETREEGKPTGWPLPDGREGGYHRWDEAKAKSNLGLIQSAGVPQGARGGVRGIGIIEKEMSDRSEKIDYLGEGTWRK